VNTRARNARIAELRDLSARLGRQAEDVAVRAGAEIEDPQAALLEALDLIESDVAAQGGTQPMPVSRRGVTARAQLLDRAAGGDEDAWDELLREFDGLVWATTRAYRLSPADAAEVRRATWFRLVKSIHLLERPDNVGGWLAGVARAESVRLVRMRSSVVPSDDLSELIREEPEPEAAVLAAVRMQLTRDSAAGKPTEPKRDDS
jgi:Sigma-70 region 2